MAGKHQLKTNKYSDVEKLLVWLWKYKQSLFHKIEIPYLEEEWNIYVKEPIVISNFTKEDDDFLYKYCPLRFVRSYLINDCGYKKHNIIQMLKWKR